MVKKVHNIVGTVVVASGEVFSEENWLSKKQVFSYQKNQALIDEYARQSDPSYLSKERAKRRYERIEARKRELKELQDRVRSEIEKLEEKSHADTDKQ